MSNTHLFLNIVFIFIYKLAYKISSFLNKHKKTIGETVFIMIYLIDYLNLFYSIKINLYNIYLIKHKNNRDNNI